MNGHKELYLVPWSLKHGTQHSHKSLDIHSGIMIQRKYQTHSKSQKTWNKYKINIILWKENYLCSESGEDHKNVNASYNNIHLTFLSPILEANLHHNIGLAIQLRRSLPCSLGSFRLHKISGVRILKVRFCLNVKIPYIGWDCQTSFWLIFDSKRGCIGVI